MDKTARFRFGENWKAYVSCISEDRILSAEQSLADILGQDALAGKTFVDIGCGSGLFSLAALRLGASRVVSFDFDEESVAAAREVKARFSPGAAAWSIEQGSVLDEEFLARLGKFDCAYSWGVLHHTGAMWRAVDLASRMVKPGGLFFIALYNDQRLASKFWKAVKVTYNRLPDLARPAFAALFFMRFWLVPTAKDLLRGRLFSTLNSYRSRRGMSAWHDVVDWVGGLPFEVAAPGQVTGFCAERGLSLVTLRQVRGHGCSEFVFKAGPVAVTTSL